MKSTIIKTESLANHDRSPFRPIRNMAGISSRLLLFGLLSLAVPFTVDAAPAKQESPPPLVTVISVTEQDVNPPMEYVGHVEAMQTVDLQARVGGFLEQVNFKEGSEVRAGDILYVIEQAPYKAKVAVAKAKVTKAQATFDRANNYLKRILNVRSGAVSATDIDAAKTDELEASAELQEAQATLALAKLDLAYTKILAPISGRIGATALTVGNLCGPNSGTLARIVQLDPIRIRYSVSENSLSAVRTALNDSFSGQEEALVRPQIRLPGGKILDLVGHVDFVDNVVDASTGTIGVRLVFDNPKGLLLPGQYVTALVSWRQPKLMSVVPQSAILDDREGRYVLVVNAQSQVEQRRVSTGATIGTMWSIESGLSIGEKVIVQGLQKVRPGQTVATSTTDTVKKGD